jgi:hypothetical protein
VSCVFSCVCMCIRVCVSVCVSVYKTLGHVIETSESLFFSIIPYLYFLSFAAILSTFPCGPFLPVYPVNGDLYLWRK